MTTNAHTFTPEQIAKISTVLGVPVENVQQLEDNENIEVVVAGAKNPLVIYVSADKDTGVVLIDVFIDDDALDNEAAYLGGIDTLTEEGISVDEALDKALEEFMQEHVTKE